MSCHANRFQPGGALPVAAVYRLDYQKGQYFRNYSHLCHKRRNGVANNPSGLTFEYFRGHTLRLSDFLSLYESASFHKAVVSALPIDLESLQNS